METCWWPTLRTEATNIARDCVYAINKSMTQDQSNNKGKTRTPDIAVISVQMDIHIPNTERKISFLHR